MYGGSVMWPLLDMPVTEREIIVNKRFIHSMMCMMCRCILNKRMLLGSDQLYEQNENRRDIKWVWNFRLTQFEIFLVS